MEPSVPDCANVLWEESIGHDHTHFDSDADLREQEHGDHDHSGHDHGDENGEGDVDTSALDDSAAGTVATTLLLVATVALGR